MCGPKFCSMNASQQMDKYLGQNQAERREKFVELLTKVSR